MAGSDFTLLGMTEPTTPSDPPATDDAKPAPSNASLAGSLVKGVVGLVVFVLLMGVLIASCGRKSEPQGLTVSGIKYSAIATCHEAVKKQLKAPKTAEFEDNEPTMTSTGWDLDGYVDSENSFGAMIRTAYTCTAVLEADRDTVSARATLADS